MVSDEFNKLISNQSDDKLKETLMMVYKLYLLDIIERDLGWYISNEIITPNAGREVSDYALKLVYLLFVKLLIFWFCNTRPPNIVNGLLKE